MLLPLAQGVGADSTGLVDRAPEEAVHACMTNLDRVPMRLAVALFVLGRFNHAPVGGRRPAVAGAGAGGAAGGAAAAGGVGHHVKAWLGWGCALGLRLAGWKHVHHYSLHVLEGLHELCIGCD